MCFFTLRSRWHGSVICVVAVALGISLVTLHQTIAKEEAAPRSISAGTDVTDEVELRLSGSLLRTGRSTYSLEAAIVNPADEPLEGPLVLVILDTGLDALSGNRVENADGRLTSGEPCFDLLAEGEELAAGRSTDLRTIVFESESRLRLGQLRQFDPEVRVIRPAPETRGDARADRQRDSARRQARVPLSPLRPTGDRLEPVPDPISTETGQRPPHRPRNRPERKKPSIEEIERVMEVQDRWTERLMAMEGVVGTGTGMDAEGQAVVRVYVERAGIRHDLPEQVDGVPVHVKVTGKFYARQVTGGTGEEPPQDKRAQAGLPDLSGGLGTIGDIDCPPQNPKSRFRAARIGISIGNANAVFEEEPDDPPDDPDDPPDPVNVCSAGTIGFRLGGYQPPGTVRLRTFILTNAHVLGRGNQAEPGEAILQPGRRDVREVPGRANLPDCALVLNDQIGNLTDFVPILGEGEGPNRIDAAIARVERRNQRAIPPCDAVEQGYRGPREETLTAQQALGRGVMKYGKETFLTFGVVEDINVTMTVTFPEFPGFADFESVFQGQILVDGDGVFMEPGDSGAGLVTFDADDPDESRFPVGLLFAATNGGTQALANPIDVVLQTLGDRNNLVLRVDSR